MNYPTKHAIEAKDSYATYLERNPPEKNDLDPVLDGMAILHGHRNLKHKHKHALLLAEQREQEFLAKEEREEQKRIEKDKIKHEEKRAELWRDSGIQEDTVHGMMIDAGSGGSRMHVFEWNPRVLANAYEVAAAVAGRKLTYPGSDSRWTDRLSPGLATFARMTDDQLLESVAQYLTPLIEFAKAVLRTKESEFSDFPIFLRATGGMRVLKQPDRFRVMDAVRTLFANDTFCPFYFENEHARVISGEEEAIFGWTGINFAMGTLIEDSEGVGTVVEPRLTYGALDMGGASTQLSFYEPNGDIMSNLFKLQIGQGKHWNLYAHSFLFYGINEAKNRLEARLIQSMSKTARLAEGVYNPCLPGGSDKLVRTNIFVNDDGLETWNFTGTDSDDGFREAILRNDRKGGDAEACLALAEEMLHKEQNEWCDFSHRGDCSFAGVYQPDLPQQGKHFGEFLAFSNYFHVWEFLDLPMRSSLRDLENATRDACSLSHQELLMFNDGRIDESEVIDYCFHSAFAFQVLHNGYGFGLDDYITATNVVNGQKVGWALGAMMYEINTFPWKIVTTQSKGGHGGTGSSRAILVFFLLTAVAMFISILFVFHRHGTRGRRSEYQPITGKH